MPKPRPGDAEFDAILKTMTERELADTIHSYCAAANCLQEMSDADDVRRFALYRARVLLGIPIGRLSKKVKSKVTHIMQAGLKKP